MSNIVSANFGSLPAEFANQVGHDDELSAGISSGFAVVSYRTSRWRTKYRGEEKLLVNEETGDPRMSIEVVLIKSATNIAKIFYKNGYKEGSSEAPECFSNNGVTPDPSAKEKQCNTCAGCPMNAWGSRTTASGKAGKACQDNKRVAIVPLGDLENEMLGGPMLLRIPAASLTEASSYGQRMKAMGFPTHMVGTRISFDTSADYPKLLFKEVRPLTAPEIKRVLDYRGDPRVARILNEGDGMGNVPADAPQYPNFDAPAAPAPAPKPTPLPAHDPETGEVTDEVKPAPRRVAAKKPEPVAAAPEDASPTGTSFDDELDAQMEALMPKR